MTLYSEEAYIVSENTMRYAIKVEGCLNKKWTDWFEGMKMRHEGETTVLEGLVKDRHTCMDCSHKSGISILRLYL
jgi:hypothetical protein